MPGDLSSRRRVAAFRHAPVAPVVIVAALSLISFAVGVAASDRARFVPKFTVGETLRYQVETRTVTTGKTTTPIENPEGESKVSQTINLLVRLDVFGVEPDARGEPGKVRLNAIFEQSRAITDRDVLNPEAPSPDEQFARLEGHSIQFTLAPNGELSDFQGAENLIPNASEADPVLSWVKALSLTSRFPRDGVSRGQKWSDEKALAGLPLADLTWRTESTYLRNEPCRSPLDHGSSSNPSAAAGDTCAVILTHFEIARRGSARSDATPDDYRRNGLRTSGSWTGSGESLDSISLSAGLLVNSTQTGTQDMDYDIVSSATGSRIHHQGHVESQSQIKLLPPSQPQP